MTKDLDLGTKIVLVTGGSRGLGKAICLELGRAGAMVVVNYLNNKSLAEEIVDQICDAGGQALAIAADVTNKEQVKGLVKEATSWANRPIDTLVNNATGPQPNLSIEESTWEDYLAQLNFFVKAPLLLTKEIIPGMRSQGQGSIINIGSEVVQLGNTNFANYVTAKSAMIGMTRAWARELGPHNIRVNLVAPGFVPVERHQGTPEETLRDYQQGLLLPFMGEPWDIAQAVLFLASDASRFITGQCLSVNGGNTFGI